MGQAPPAAPMPIRLLDSTPPPMVMSCCPAMISAAAKLTASRPEAQKRLIWTPGTPSPIACRERRHARDIAARLADRIDTTKYHVVDERRVEVVALLYRCQRVRRQIERGHLMQRAIRLAAPSWRANVIVDEGVGHGVPLAVAAPQKRAANEPQNACNLL